ncbi:hypothetical protein F511_41685 [Dorcoceras hygrometricum]|uniref:Uncharacterized protein n=1 Tax=Dorcoceras hygrometricum TaxID=472368 RepID=A0A2Z7ALH3_9LAMI|nr:hypothetical protein F511_41685 [Dorcoceras hygrometricum]
MVISSRRSLVLVLLAQTVLAAVVVPRVCPLSGSQQTAVPPQGRGGSSRGRSFPMQQQRLGEPQFRPFQQPGPLRFGQSSQPQFSGPQYAQVNAITREQAEGTPGGGVITGTCVAFDFPVHVVFDTGASHSFIADACVVEHGFHTTVLCDVVTSQNP